MVVVDLVMVMVVVMVVGKVILVVMVLHEQSKGCTRGELDGNGGGGSIVW